MPVFVSASVLSFLPRGLISASPLGLTPEMLISGTLRLRVLPSVWFLGAFEVVAKMLLDLKAFTGIVGLTPVMALGLLKTLVLVPNKLGAGSF